MHKQEPVGGERAGRNSVQSRGTKLRRFLLGWSLSERRTEELMAAVPEGLFSNCKLSVYFSSMPKGRS